MATTAVAEPSTTLVSALKQTLRHHPALARIDEEIRQLPPAVELALQRPANALGIEVENLGKNADDRLETTLSVAGVLEWGDKAAARGDVALSTNTVARLELEQQRRNVLVLTASQFIKLAVAEASRNQAVEALELARRIRQASRRRQDAGAASEGDVQRAALIESRAQLQLDDAEQSLALARQALQLAMGDPPEKLGPIAADLSDLPALPDIDSLIDAASSTPMILIVGARGELARSRLALARRESKPNLNWSLGVRDDRERDDQALVLGFSLPLGQGRRSRHQRAIAESGLAASQHETQSAELELKSLLLASWQALARWRRHAAALDEHLIPQAEEIVRTLQRGYEQGRYSLLELASAQRELYQLQSEQLTARLHYHQSWIELERLLGRSLLRSAESENS